MDAQQNQAPHPAFGMESSSTLWMTQSLLIGLVFLAIVLGVFLWLRKKKQAGPQAPVDPWAELLKNLAGLSWNQNDYANFFISLNLLLRQALELKLGQGLRARTRRELVKELSLHPALSSDFQELCAEFLETAEQVVYADKRVDAQAGRFWQERVGQCIEQLRREAPLS